ncbi:MAG: hypothetical protein ABJE10_19775, partial [bacterium]
MRVLWVRGDRALERIDRGDHTPAGQCALPLLIRSPGSNTARANVTRGCAGWRAVETEQIRREQAQRTRLHVQQIARPREHLFS